MFNSHKGTISSQDVLSPVFKILLIVRPGRLVNLLKLELSHQGYEVEVVHDGISGLLKFQESKPQLIVLDWNISIFSAADLCYRLLSQNNSTSIFVLDLSRQNCRKEPINDLPHNRSTLPKNDNSIEHKPQRKPFSKTSPYFKDNHIGEQDLDSVTNRIAALDAGAEDCLSYPFDINEFLARIRVQLRKHQVQKPSVLIFEDLWLNASTREVYRGDRSIYLTTKEFALLEYLLTHPRQVLTRNQIIERVWGYEYLGDSNIIEVYIRYLRLKTEKNNSKRLIYTVRSVGYVLRESSFC